eukprot:764177-Hanusia_phi.AAC.1
MDDVEYIPVNRLCCFIILIPVAQVHMSANRFRGALCSLSTRERDQSLDLFRCGLLSKKLLAVDSSTRASRGSALQTSRAGAIVKTARSKFSHNILPKLQQASDAGMLRLTGDSFQLPLSDGGWSRSCVRVRQVQVAAGGYEMEGNEREWSDAFPTTTLRISADRRSVDQVEPVDVCCPAETSEGKCYEAFDLPMSVRPPSLAPSPALLLFANFS